MASTAVVVDRKERRRKWWAQKLRNNTKTEKDSSGDGGGEGRGRERGKATDLDTQRLSRKQTRTKNKQNKQQIQPSSSSSLLECGTSSAGFRSTTASSLTQRHSGEGGVGVGGVGGQKDVIPLPLAPCLTDPQSDAENHSHGSSSSSESLTDHRSQPVSEQGCDGGSGGGGGGERKRRYIAFVGNLPYSATVEEVVEHFTKRGVKLVDARLLTRRDGGGSRGCCFIEFSNSKSLQNGLKFNHTLMAGRRLNVEVTCGGGGRGEKRTKKIKERNEKLQKSQQRKRIKNLKNQKMTSHS